MEFRHLQWSATTCDFPGAGVYFGLAVPREHAAVARQLTVKQLRTMAGGSVVLRADAPPFPFNYFAVRDPSAVKVKALNQPPLENGFRHVELAFNFERSYKPHHDPEAERAAAELEEACERDGKPATAAFLVTIGLPLAREDGFFRELIGRHPGQGWEDFYHRIAVMGASGR
jgi:hypothetical protein